MGTMVDTLSADSSRQLLASIVDSSDDAIISKNLDGIVTSWNASARRIFGYTEEEMVGKSIMVIIPSNLRDEEKHILSRIHQGKRVDHFETTRLTKAGKHVLVSLTVSPIRSADGTVIGASKVARDITERKEVERALAEAQHQLQLYAIDLERRVEERTGMLMKTVAELEAFSYSLSHDLRAPLRAIQSFLQIVQEEQGHKLDAEGNDMLNKVISGAQRMDRMVLDLLTFTRLTHEEMAVEPVDLESLIRTILQERSEFQSPKTEIILELPLLPVQGNPASLRQCMNNLLDNAVKFIAPGVIPRIRIHSEKAGTMVRLWVEDNGIGLDAQAKEQLFTMFQRFHGNQYPGTGIGLAIVRKAVERMGGKAGVESEPGQGSRFWLELPGLSS